MLCPVILDSSCPKSMDFMKAVEAKVTAEITINTAKSKKPRRGLDHELVVGTRSDFKPFLGGCIRFLVFIILKNSFRSRTFRQRWLQQGLLTVPRRGSKCSSNKARSRIPGSSNY
jgi:hypothetical protein